MSAENSNLKSQLLEASKVLRLFTTAKGNFKGTFCPSCRSKYDFVPKNSDAWGPKLHDTIFGQSDTSRGDGLDEEEFPDIESYSQSKCVAASPVTLLFSHKVKKDEAGESDDGPGGEAKKKTDDVPEREDANIPRKKKKILCQMKTRAG